MAPPTIFYPPRSLIGTLILLDSVFCMYLVLTWFMFDLLFRLGATILPFP